MTLDFNNSTHFQNTNISVNPQLKVTQAKNGVTHYTVALSTQRNGKKYELFVTNSYQSEIKHGKTGDKDNQIHKNMEKTLNNLHDYLSKDLKPNETLEQRFIISAKKSNLKNTENSHFYKLINYMTGNRLEKLFKNIQTLVTKYFSCEKREVKTNIKPQLKSDSKEYLRSANQNNQLSRVLESYIERSEKRGVGKDQALENFLTDATPDALKFQAALSQLKSIEEKARNGNLSEKDKTELEDIKQVCQDQRAANLRQTEPNHETKIATLKYINRAERLINAFEDNQLHETTEIMNAAKTELDKMPGTNKEKMLTCVSKYEKLRDRTTLSENDAKELNILAEQFYLLSESFTDSELVNRNENNIFGVPNENILADPKAPVAEKSIEKRKVPLDKMEGLKVIVNEATGKGEQAEVRSTLVCAHMMNLTLLLKENEPKTSTIQLNGQAEKMQFNIYEPGISKELTEPVALSDEFRGKEPPKVLRNKPTFEGLTSKQTINELEMQDAFSRNFAEKLRENKKFAAYATENAKKFESQQRVVEGAFDDSLEKISKGLKEGTVKRDEAFQNFQQLALESFKKNNSVSIEVDIATFKDLTENGKAVIPTTAGGGMLKKGELTIVGALNKEIQEGTWSGDQRRMIEYRIIGDDDVEHFTESFKQSIEASEEAVTKYFNSL